ncbi:MAG: HD domain-containing phosphohydrolase [Acidobacteriota bacterium]
MGENGRSRIFVIEDDQEDISVINSILSPEHDIFLFENGEAALNTLKTDTPDLILLDLVLSGLDGFDICRKLKEVDSGARDIPLVVLSSFSAPEKEEAALSTGAIDYLAKPIHGSLLKARVKNHLELKKNRDNLESLVQQRTIELLLTKKATLTGMTVMAERRDPETEGHLERTKRFVKCLAEELSSSYPEELTDEEIDILYQSAPLHDIGKIGIPDRILLKPASLTREEYEEMKNHTLIGSTIINEAEKDLGSNSFLHTAREIAESHHENWDGSGYPHGLKGQEIPLSARLMTVADVYDALVSKRPYKEPFTHEQAMDIIFKGDNRTKPEHFEPMVLAAFRERNREINKIAVQYAD